ncbi:MAG: HlyD family secretion protein [Candidatus Berkiellales bacterium]
MSSLFRKEALEHRKDRLYGDVILLQPLSLSILVGAVIVICLMILTILFWGTYARKETVRGYLIPDKGIVKISVPHSGTIDKVHIREGDQVLSGQILLTILSERTLKSGADIDTLKLHEIETTQKQQLERIAGLKSLLAAENSRLKSHIQSLKKELELIETSLKNQEDRNSILESRVVGVKKLFDKKNISEIDYQKINEEWITQKLKYQELLSAKSKCQNTLAQTESELEQLPIKNRSMINEIENSISELKQRHADVEGHRTLDIRAPINGTVTSLQAREGQWLGANTASANMPLLAILPNDAMMQAELYVPSRAIGFISYGQTVRVRYDAFPYRRFGIYEGKVKAISKHVLLPHELTVPIESKDPIYRITLDLQRQAVTAYGRDFPLQAGMSLEADIILDKQTLFEWVLDPLLSLRGRF